MKNRYKYFSFLIHVGVWLSIFLLVYDALNRHLTANPVQAAEQRTGQLAIFFLILTLMCTPFSRILAQPAIIRYRRLFGLYTFFYASIHAFIYIYLDYGFVWNLIYQSIIEERYISIGVIAFLILTLLAIGSFRWGMNLFGNKWKGIQRLIYLCAVLVSFHFILVKKGNLSSFRGDVLLPLLVCLVILTLLILRIPVVENWLASIHKLLKPNSLK